MDEFGITFPVLSDLGYEAQNYERDGMIPSKTLLAPGGEIVIVDGEVGDADIEAVLP